MAAQLTGEDIALLRSIIREESERAAERLEARLRGHRVKGQRRVRSPELAAQIAAETAQVDDVARARAAQALRRIRRGRVG